LRNLKLIVGIVIFIVLIAVFLAKMGFLNPGRGNIDKYRDSSLNSKNPASPAFVGGRVCAECHKAEYDLWSGSHHDLAMQNASDVTVLGDFGNKELDYYGLKSEFYKSDGKFMVRTDGPDGKLHDYKIKYTFGVYPLQQYLIEFPNGRLQALGIAWDSRPSEEGGQRWFHLYPNEKITHNDTLHWTGIDQNWNFMCAECHSTNLRKNYDLKTNSFNTSWSEINVSCEACHGPGSEHVEWARQKNKDEFPNKGLLVNFNYRKGISWIFDEESGTVVRSKPLETHTEIKVCSRCHSRRSAISDNYV
jgi:Zn finger protein HypA/HybF involved in hydrogenase expression